jgi:hypothetical protein
MPHHKLSQYYLIQVMSSVYMRIRNYHFKNVKKYPTETSLIGNQIEIDYHFCGVTFVFFPCPVSYRVAHEMIQYLI